MKDKKSRESRRKLLKSIAAGSGAIVAGKSLPESWSRPVVDSVMLPAHALTSGTNCPPMTLLDLQVSCSTTPDPGEQIIYVVEESAGNCPTLVTRPTFQPPEPTATKIMVSRRRFYAGASAGTAQVDIFHLQPSGTQGYLIRTFINNCDATGSPLNCDGFDQTPFQVTGTLGGTYTLSAQSSCDSGTGSLSIFNIVIQ